MLIVFQSASKLSLNTGYNRLGTAGLSSRQDPASCPCAWSVVVTYRALQNDENRLNLLQTMASMLETLLQSRARPERP